MVEFVMSSQVSLITSWATFLQRRQCQVLNSFSKSVMFTGVDWLSEKRQPNTQCVHLRAFMTRNGCDRKIVVGQALMN